MRSEISHGRRQELQGENASVLPIAINPGAPAWLRAVARLTQAVGRPTFEQRLFELLNGTFHIDECVVFTITGAHEPGHLFTCGRLPQDKAEGLARDYVDKYYERDPYFAKASDRRAGGKCRPFRPRLEDEYDPEYRAHFFARHDLIDKISTIGRVEEGNVYCNFWRMGESGCYTRQEEVLLNSVLPLLTSLISLHFRMVQPSATRSAPETGPDVARNLVHSVISRGTQPFHLLAPREAQVCERILIGFTSTGISLDLNIAVSSVNTYRRRAYEKLNIATQNELFWLCLEALDRTRN
ncbi:MAG: helix-turn-helix transcriptional regulator [Gammaproteobacteria bacterium]|nr:helix-turn-helix transcriptional regulator [Gammaproteobacteria bacterium]